MLDTHARVTIAERAWWIKNEEQDAQDKVEVVIWKPSTIAEQTSTYR